MFVLFTIVAFQKWFVTMIKSKIEADVCIDRGKFCEYYLNFHRPPHLKEVASMADKNLVGGMTKMYAVSCEYKK